MSTIRHTGANGSTAPWTAAENAALRLLYPSADRAQVKAALPGRSWNAMGLHAAHIGIKRCHYWTPERGAILAAHYPAQGAAYVAQLLGCSAAKVTKQASLRGIAFVRPPKPIPTSKSLKVVKAAIPPKPKPAPIASTAPKPVAAPVAQHQPARLSNLINQKARLRQERVAAVADRAVTVAYIKTLPYHDPEAHHYRMGGERAVLAYRAQQLKQAA